MLAASRRQGVEFDRAWESAWVRCNWPHDTAHRRQWKAQLEEDKESWRAAYQRKLPANRALLLLVSLTVERDSSALLQRVR